MTPSSRLRMVVIGASASGMFAAAAAVAAGHLVTVLERDELSDLAEPRDGVPQSWQPHIFLHRGLRCLEELLPGIRDDLLAAGAIPFQTGRLAWLSAQGWFDIGRPSFEVLSMTRPLLDRTVRRRVSALPGLDLRPGVRVNDVRRPNTGAAASGWVVGVVGAAPLTGVDVVVDASGRSSRLPHWLPHAGVPAASTTRIDAGVGYATRMYRPVEPDRLRDDGFVGAVLAQNPDTMAGGLVVPVEHGHWLLGATGCTGRRPPRDESGFAAFLARLPDPVLAAFAASAEPMGDVHLHRQTANVRHHYADVRGWPDGLLVVGDALCALNPIYGQGITVAAMEALMLREALAESRRPGWSRRLLRRFDVAAALPWSIATGEDLRYDTSEGHPTVTQAAVGQWTRELAVLAAHGNGRSQDVVSRVYHLMGSPARLFDPRLLGAAARGRMIGYGPLLPRPAALASLAVVEQGRGGV